MEKSRNIHVHQEGWNVCLNLDFKATDQSLETELMTVICDDSGLIEHLFPHWKLTKVKLLLIFDINLGITVSSIESTLWIIRKSLFYNYIVTRKVTFKSFSFPFSSLYETIRSFWVKDSISSDRVFPVEKFARFVGLGGASCVLTRLGLTQFINTEGDSRVLAFHNHI